MTSIPSFLNIFRMTAILAALLAAVFVIAVSDDILGYYHYTIPIMDYKVEYTAADFHSYRVGLPLNFGVAGNVTLLEDDSIDVDFVPSPKYNAFDNIPYFVHTENIKPGQTFIVACGGLGNPTSEESDILTVLKYTGTKVLEDPGYDFAGKYDHYIRGIEALNGTKAYEFFHIDVYLKAPVKCDYPDVIKWSIDVVKTDGREDTQDGWLRIVKVGDT